MCLDADLSDVNEVSRQTKNDTIISNEQTCCLFVSFETLGHICKTRPLLFDSTQHTDTHKLLPGPVVFIAKAFVNLKKTVT